MSRVRAALLSATLGLSACAPTYAEGYLDAFQEGLRAQNAGRWQEAAGHFDRAAELGDRYKDRDEARLMYAEAQERLGRFAEAEAAYRKVEKESEGRYQGQRAAFALGRLVWQQRGFEEGSEEVLRAVRAYPDHGNVRHAVKRLLAHVEEKHGPHAALAWLAPIEKELHDTEAGEAVTYEYGTLLARADQKALAVKTLLALARAHPYPQGSLTDDAFFVASIFLDDLGQPQEAIDVLEEMLAPREAAYLGSSYQRPRFPMAAYRIAILKRDRLKDRPAAKAGLWRVHRDHFESRQTDDALWDLARMEKDDGNQEEVCEVLEVLKKDKPASRYQNCLHLLCSSLPKTERGCSNKIMLELGLDPDSDWDDRPIK